MGPWAYYSPLWLGALLSAAVYGSNMHALAFPGWRHGLHLALGCPLVGLVCQLLMVGSQGAFAQVLPVPWGKSIRGRGAVVAGWFLLLALAGAAVAVLLQTEGLAQPAWLGWGFTGLAGLAAGGAYVWALPTAMSDFLERD